mmetsp:Transcript_36498/g.67964  ORF Transcript_36498/g.67964 Transcript_36498/m.67964 type:complete len:323 (-) Transcript_36498:1165-2133(-)
MPILQDRRQARQEILDRRSHLRHTDDVHDGFQSAENGAEHLGILFSQVLVQEQTQVPHHLLLTTLLHHHGDSGDEVCGLLTDTGRWSVQAPPDDTGDLGEVRLDARTQGVHDCAEAVEHDCGVIGGLLLEGIHDAVNDLLLQSRVDICHTQIANHLVNGLHNHLPVWLRCVFKVLYNSADDVGTANLVGNLHRRVHQLPVVSSIQGHSDHPEISEEGRQNILADVARLDTLSGDTLLHHLEHDLLHLLVRSGELSDQDDHHLSGVVVGVLGVHQRDDVTDGLQEGSEAFAAMFADAFPQGPQHGVEGLDTVGHRSLRQGCQG